MFGLLFPLHITAYRRFPAFRSDKRTHWKTRFPLCVPWLPPTGCHVRCQQCIFRMKQRFLCGNGRLTVKYIHRSSCDPSFVQSLCQCLAVYDKPLAQLIKMADFFISAIFSALIIPLVSLLFGVCREIISHSLNRSSSGLYAIPAAFTSSLSCLA